MEDVCVLLVFIGLSCGGLALTAVIGKGVERILADFIPDEESADELEALHGNRTTAA